MTIGENHFSALLPEPTPLKFYFPIWANIGKTDEDEDWTDDISTLDGPELIEYKEDILKAILDDRSPIECQQGIMRWYHDRDAVSEKVQSALFTVEERDGQLWGVADCQVRGKLSPEEMEILKEYITNQASADWGSRFEECEIFAGENSLFVHFWSSCDWSIMTEQERFDPEYSNTETEDFGQSM